MADLRGHNENGSHVYKTEPPDFSIQQNMHNASCAGNAEAGWIATRAAVDRFLKGKRSSHYSDLLEPILAAFPLELLDS